MAGKSAEPNGAKEAGMEFVRLSNSTDVLDGLRLMLRQYILEENEWVQPLVNVEIALLIVEIAKNAQDEDIWFPHGKWATIQAIEERIEHVILDAMYPTGKKVAVRK